MRKNKPPAVVIHMVPPPPDSVIADEINRVYARSIRRCLLEGSLTPEQKNAVLDELIRRLHTL